MSNDELAVREFWEKQMGLSNWKLINLLSKDSRIERIFKGDIIAEQDGKIVDIPFLISGIAKGYWTDQNNNRHLFCFGYHPGEPLTAICAVEKEITSFCTIEVAKSGKALFIPARRVYEIIHSDVEGSALYALLLENSFHEMVERVQINYSLSATNRYLWFQKKYPGLEQWITAKDVASFLNINPSSLSRLKAEVLKGGG